MTDFYGNKIHNIYFINILVYIHFSKLYLPEWSLYFLRNFYKSRIWPYSVAIKYWFNDYVDVNAKFCFLLIFLAYDTCISKTFKGKTFTVFVFVHYTVNVFPWIYGCVDWQYRHTSMPPWRFSCEWPYSSQTTKVPLQNFYHIW